MRIGINLRPLRPGKMGGHEFYAQNLLRYLIVPSAAHEYFLFTSPWNDSTLNFPQSRQILVGAEDPSGSHRAPSTPAGEMHRWAEKLRLNLWFCPMANLEPRNLSIPTVVTIPDLQHEYYPQFFPSEERGLRQLMYKPSCQEATAVIAVSEFTQNCISQRYQVSSQKIFCIHEAAGDQFRGQFPLPSLEEIRKKYGLPPLYAFYPANTWPHKNHQLLILAFHRFRQKCNLPLHLVLCGAKEHGDEFLQELIRHFSLQELVHHLGYVGDLELPRLYQGAAFLIFPSLFEGFGLPLLEAMHMGCPVLASRESALAEVGGDAMLVFDPRQPDSIAAAMIQILKNPSLRRTVVDRGFAQTQRFSWARAAQETLAVFDYAYRQGRPSPRHDPVVLLGGIYEDGWATERTIFDIARPLIIRELELEGQAHPACSPLGIEIRVDCKRRAKLEVAQAGPFRLVEPVYIDCQDGRRVRVELIADRSFRPSQMGLRDDGRVLSIQLSSIKLKTQDGKELVVR